MTAPAGQDWEQGFAEGVEPLGSAGEAAPVARPEHLHRRKGKSAASPVDSLPQEARELGVGAAAFQDEGFRYLPLAKLFESPQNPRKRFDAAKLEELTASVRTSGILAPLVVRPAPKRKGCYEIGAGHRRFRAAQAAGLTEVPAVVRPMDDREFLELLAIENLQREDLHPLEEAEGYRQLMTGAGYDVARLAERTGHSSRYVYDSLTLLKLTPEAKKLFLAGKFERGHAIELARLTPAQQKEILELEPDFREPSGLWQSEQVEEDPHADEQEDLELEFAVKPVSVRELKHFINDHFRATPETIDAFLLPQTAEQLAAAAAAKRKVVHITYDYRVPDAARDPKVRTYGEAGWMRADGQYQSKSCDHAVLGLVVAGPGRGEAFPVCVAKEKCAAHWRDWQKERERRQAEQERYAAKEAKGTKATGGPPRETKPAKPVMSHEQRQTLAQAVVKDLFKGWLPGIRELADAFKKLPDLLLWNLAIGGQPIFESWASKVGERGRSVNLSWDLTDELCPLLPGSWRGTDPRDCKAASYFLGALAWMARDAGKADTAVEKEIVKRFEAQVVAAKAALAKKPATKPAPKKAATPKGKKR